MAQAVAPNTCHLPEEEADQSSVTSGEEGCLCGLAEAPNTLDTAFAGKGGNYTL